LVQVKTIKLRSYCFGPVGKNLSQSIQALRMALSKAYFPLSPFHLKMEAGIATYMLPTF
jgi:hypothetical protein